MLTIVEDEKSVRDYHAILSTSIQKVLHNKETFTLGYSGGNFDSAVYYDVYEGLWWSSFEFGKDESSPRIWNGFGVQLDLNKSQNIVVEINMPTNGINRNVSGLFAKDQSTNDVFLLHRGGVGGGRKGIGKENFKNWYRGKWVSVFEYTTESEVILITNIFSDHVVQDITEFVRQVWQFKQEVKSGNFSRTLKLSGQKPSLFTFAPEFSGKKHGNRKSYYTAECQHGRIVNGLETWISSQSEQAIKTFNNQFIDLGIYSNDTIISIYEVKTSADKQSIYTGIGQLMFHASEYTDIKKYLVLPKCETALSMKRILNNIGIMLILYMIDGNTVRFE